MDQIVQFYATERQFMGSVLVARGRDILFSRGYRSMRPVEYTYSVQGFGTWRISYVPETKIWRLAYNARARGAQWLSARDFAVPESAAMAVGERTTGVQGWDCLRFAAGKVAELSTWTNDVAEGVQKDAAD